MASGGLSPLRSLLREVRPLDGKHARVARALLPPQTRETLLGPSVNFGDQVFRNSILHRPGTEAPSELVEFSDKDGKVPLVGFSNFRKRIRCQLRKSPGSLDAPSVAAATVSVCSTLARLPLPSCCDWQPAGGGHGVEVGHGMQLITNEADVKAGDLIVAHPCLTEEGLGGCVGIVLRHSPLDTLCLVLNVDAGVNSDLGWNSTLQRQRPSWRLHIHLPPLRQQDPRRDLPEALRQVPLHWGGPYPTPLHLLHTVPLVPPTKQITTFQQPSGIEVTPGLWCSFVDDDVLQAAAEKVHSGLAQPSDFGAYVGMMFLEPGRLGASMIQNHWFVARPSNSRPSAIPVQGWGCKTIHSDGQWVDDRQWSPWRSIMSQLGGEFADWAGVDWVSTRGKLNFSEHWRTMARARAHRTVAQESSHQNLEIKRPEQWPELL